MEVFFNFNWCKFKSFLHYKEIISKGEWAFFFNLTIEFVIKDIGSRSYVPCIKYCRSLLIKTSINVPNPQCNVTAKYYVIALIKVESYFYLLLDLFKILISVKQGPTVSCSLWY